MIKDLFVSFKDNIKSKSSNPFFVTYGFIWCMRNWRAIYTLFFFDQNTPLNKRLEILSSYFTKNTFVVDIFINIIWTIGALILTYTLINLSRLIVNLFEKKLTPYVYKITDSNSIVLKETYDRLRIEKQDLENKLEKERESKGRLQAEISSLEAQLEEHFRANAEREGEESLEGKGSKSPNQISDDIILLLNKIKVKNLVEDFINITIDIQKQGGAYKTESSNIAYYLKIGLIKITKREGEWTMYQLTQNGEKVLEKARLEVE